MSYYASPALPWTVSEEDEQRFRTILRRLLIFFVLISLAMPFLPLPRVERAPPEVPPRFAKLLLERPAPPPPAAVVKAPEPETVRPDATKPEPKVVKPEKIDKVEPKKNVEVARRRAERAGLLAMKDDLADLRDSSVAEKLAKAKPGPGLGTGSGPGVGSSSGPALGAGARAIITGNVARGSGGVNTSRLSSGFGGGGLAGRSTTQVNSPVGGGGGGGGGSVQRGGAGLARSLEEIKLVFDKNKSAIYAIYNRALREDPGLQGKVVLKLTIAPSGEVTGCEVVSSELRAPDLERKLVARIRQFDFGAKAVNIMVVTYPIDFLPS